MCFKACVIICFFDLLHICFLQKYKKILFSIVIIIILTFFRQWRVTIPTVNKTKPAVLCLILLSVDNGIKKKRALVRIIFFKKISTTRPHTFATCYLLTSYDVVECPNHRDFDHTSTTELRKHIRDAHIILSK